MYYSLVHYPKIDTLKIDEIRRKYDPTYKLIGPHITIVFPFQDSAGIEPLKRHIEKTTEDWKPFEIHLRGFEKSWDNWLFLNMDEGNDQVIKLHDELYTGIFEHYLRKDLPFSPHISLGLFVDKNSGYTLKNPKKVGFSETKYKTALKEAKDTGLDYKANFDRLTLIKLNDDFSGIIESKEFLLV